MSVRAEITRRGLLAGVAALAVAPLRALASDPIECVVLSDDLPYLLRDDLEGRLFRCEYLGGSLLFFRDDRVLLTTDNGVGSMISLSSSRHRVCRVFVEEI